jgi:diguanylate cyclase
MKKMAKLMKDGAAPVGKAARLGGNDFALLLPEKNKKEAASIAEDIRRRAEALSFTKDPSLRVTVSGGVSENPIDGATAEELFKKAVSNLRYAKSLGKNRVVT